MRLAEQLGYVLGQRESCSDRGGGCGRRFVLPDQLHLDPVAKRLCSHVQLPKTASQRGGVWVTDPGQVIGGGDPVEDLAALSRGGIRRWLPSPFGRRGDTCGYGGLVVCSRDDGHLGSFSRRW